MSPYKHLPLLKNTIDQLSEFDSYKEVCHEHKVGEPMPSVDKLEEIVRLLREILFPGYFGNSTVHPDSMRYYVGVNTEKVFELLTEQVLAGLCFVCKRTEAYKITEHRETAINITLNFIASLPKVRRLLTMDVQAAYDGDPAAQSFGEVIFCYPSIRAISNYRIAHELVKLDVPIIPRIISEMAHSETGIDIHPKAQINESFAIDHGTGVVIGATAIIGKNVKLFQGVTLGAKSFPLDENGNPIKGIPRHPVVEDDVVIYSNATILGRITLGKGCVIGGNVWVTNDVDPGAKIVQMKPRDNFFRDGGGI